MQAQASLLLLLLLLQHWWCAMAAIHSQAQSQKQVLKIYSGS
jgi:hypothetical protein